MTGRGGQVVFDGVGFHYPGNEVAWVIRDFDLTIGASEFYVLIGPSGCGKTTALNLLAGFERTSVGEVTVGGAPVTSPGPERVVIFQGEDSLYPWLDVRQNVEFGLSIAGVPAAERRARVDRYLDLVRLAGHEHKFPNQLSGGMKQRVQLARALVVESPIILMDEPFGALDAQTRSSLQEELARIWSQGRRTILFITHDISEAILLGDRVGVMGHGPNATLKESVPIDLPRPRNPAAPEFAALYGRLSDLLRHEREAAEATGAAVDGRP